MQNVYIRGERCNCTHLTLNRYERVFIERFQFYRNGSRRIFNRYYHGTSDKVKFLIEEMLFLKDQKHAERTIAHLCEVMERRNVMTKTDYRLQK
jgi:hypothetical protein